MLDSDRMVSHYQVRSVLGRGGMGVVYLARDARLGRRVALKVIEKLSGHDPDAFLREARLTAEVNHPNIVAVYDVGEVDGQPWVALEYVEGRPLRQLLEDGRLPPMQTIRLLQPVASALLAAHGAGIVHRDLKPENVIIGTDGRPRVVDFGLAVQTTATEQRPTTAAGTPDYIAPEVWKGQVPTEAVDIWALGVMLFEALSGHHPWEAESDRGIPSLRGALQAASEPPLLPDETDLPPGLGTLVSRCLAIAPEDRPTARHIADELDRLLRRAPDVGEVCPFRGLLPFEAEQAAWFFGRDADIGAMVEQIEAYPRLALVGPSGVGKSSLVHAGLVPRLRERGWWIVVSMRPGPTPLATLARVVQRRLDSAASSLHAGAAPTGGLSSGAWFDDEATCDAFPPLATGAFQVPSEPDDLATAITTSPGRLGLALQALATQRGARVLLVVDQLEEVQTQGASPEEGAHFLAAIALAAQDPSDDVRVVVTVRDDHLGRLAAGGAAELLARLSVVRPLDAAGLAAVIREPLVATGHRFDDPTLADEMVAAVAHEPGALPLLQFTARCLWDRRDQERRLLRRADHDALGGVGGALAHHAEDVVHELSGGALPVVRAILLRLVHDDGTRRPAGYDALVEGLTPHDVALDVRERLVAARLLVVREGEAGQRTVELAHESLAVRWDRLRRWRYEARDEVRVVADIEAAARLWARRGSTEAGLWGGVPLDEARRTLADGSVGLSEVGASFFSASDARDRQLRTRRRRLIAGVAAAAVLVTLGSTGAAVAYSQQRQDAVRQAEHAADARAMALVSSAEAAWEVGDRLEARARLRAGLERLDSAPARALWSRIRRQPLLWHQQEAPASFQMHASRDGTHAVVASAGGLLRLVNLATSASKALRVGRTDIASAAVSDDHSLVVGVRYDGSLIRWEPEADLWQEAPLLAPGYLAHRTWLAADGTLVVFSISGTPPQGTLWTLPPGATTPSRIDLPTGHTQATASPGAKWLITAGPGAPNVQLWRLQPGFHLEADIQLPAGSTPDTVLVDEDGVLLAVLGDRPSLVDRQGVAVRALQPTPGRVMGGGFTDRGARLVTLSHDGSLSAWRTADGALEVVQPVAVPTTTLHDANVTSTGALVFTHLYGFGALDPAALTAVETLPGHTGRLDAVDASPQGSWVASGGSDALVLLHDAYTGQFVGQTEGLGGAVNAVRFSPSGQRLAAAANGGAAVVLSVPGMEELARISLGDDVLAAELLHDDLLRTLTWSGVVRDTALDGPSPRTLSERALGSEAYDMRRMPDGETVVALTDGRVVRLDAPSVPLLTHTDAPHSLATGADVVASAGFDDMIRVSRPPLTIPISTDGRLALSPDGARLAYPGPSGGLRVRDLATGIEHEMHRVVAPVDAVAFSANGDTVFGTARGGSVLAWSARNGAPQWRGVALTTTPPGAWTHLGWTPLGASNAPPGPALPSDTLRADLQGEVLCTLSTGGQVARQDGARPSLEAAHGPAWDVAILGDGCVVLDDAGLHWHRPDGTTTLLGAARAMTRRGDGLEALDGEHLKVYGPLGDAAGTWRVPAEATMAMAVADTTCTGFEDGQVLCDDRPPLRGTPATAVVTATAWRDDAIALGFADGVAGIWSIQTGAPLVRTKVDGAVARLAVVPDGVLVLSVVGDARRLDTTMLEEPWCDVLQEVAAAVPVTWSGERVALAGPLTGACGAR